MSVIGTFYIREVYKCSTFII